MPPDFTTLQSIPGAIWLGTAEGFCEFANEALARTLGVSPTELLGLGWREFLPSEDRQEILTRLAGYAKLQKTFRTRLRLVSSARIRTFRAEGTVLRPQQSELPLILLSLEDITYAVRASFRRQMRSEQLRICFEHTPVGMAFLDTALQVVRANPFLHPLFSASPSAIEGHLLSELLAKLMEPAAVNEVIRVCQHTLQTGSAHVLTAWPMGRFPGTSRLRFADWEIRRIDTTENIPVGVLLTVSDITSAHEYRTELSRAQESLELRVLERTTELAAANRIIEDRARQQASVAELGAKALSGTDTQILIEEAASTILSILHVDFCSIRELTPDHEHLVLRGAAGWPKEVCLDRLRAGTRSQSGFTIFNGTPVTVADMDTETRFEISPSVRSSGCKSSASVALAFEKEAFGAIGVFTLRPRSFSKEDMDYLQAVANVLAAAIQRQRAEEGLHFAREQAEDANRAKSEFLSRMSHELRTPLNAILGFAQLLEIDAPGLSQIESIGHITRAGKHLLTLINEVLDIARIEASRMELTLEPIELSDFLSPCLELMQPLAALRGVTLRFAPPLKPVYIRADRQKLNQVVLNLLSNAIKYNHPGGEVELQVVPGELTSRLRVTDTGPGIPKEKHPDLFTPFQRLGAEKSEVEGTGLGLSLCKGLLNAMDGAIGLDCALGKGCVFWAELPCAHPSDPPQLRLEPALNSGNPATERNAKL